MTDPKTIPTPCTGLCSIDHRYNLCVGCFRTLEEIAGWSGFDEKKKKHILAQLPRRAEAFRSGDE